MSDNGQQGRREVPGFTPGPRYSIRWQPGLNVHGVCVGETLIYGSDDKSRALMVRDLLNDAYAKGRADATDQALACRGTLAALVAVYDASDCDRRSSFDCVVHDARALLAEQSGGAQ